MPCYHPLRAYHATTVNSKTGKRGIVFNPNKAYTDLPITIPCGQCIGCRLDRSRQWAIRCVHEAQLHEDNSFITLTFNQASIDSTHSLNKSDFQKFMKRLRKYISPKKIRYYHCGEYGEVTHRPHHHACLFGYQFPDLNYYKSINSIPLYTSETLSQIWQHGHSLIGNVTYESAAYVARYIMKKQTGEAGKIHYKSRIPPYTTMSRRPGLAKEWLDKYKDDVYPHDYVVIGTSKKGRPPRYYDQQMEKEFPVEFSQVKINRFQKALEQELSENSSLSRLQVREKVRIAKTQTLIREL